MSTSDPTVRAFLTNAEASTGEGGDANDLKARESTTHETAQQASPHEASPRPTVTSIPRSVTSVATASAVAGGEVEPTVPGARAPRPSSARPTGARPAVSAPARPPARMTAARPGQSAGPRRARLTVARVDPWGILKISFLLAVALGIVYVVAAAVLWNVVDGMGVFRDINDVVRQIEGENSDFDIYLFVGLQRVLSLATVIAVVNVVIITLLATLFAFLYNLGSALVGGTRVTLTDE